MSANLKIGIGNHPINLRLGNTPNDKLIGLLDLQGINFAIDKELTFLGKSGLNQHNLFSLTRNWLKSVKELKSDEDKRVIDQLVLEGIGLSDAWRGLNAPVIGNPPTYPAIYRDYSLDPSKAPDFFTSMEALEALLYKGSYFVLSKKRPIEIDPSNVSNLIQLQGLLKELSLQSTYPIMEVRFQNGSRILPSVPYLFSGAAALQDPSYSEDTLDTDSPYRDSPTSIPADELLSSIRHGEVEPYTPPPMGYIKQAGLADCLFRGNFDPHHRVLQCNYDSDNERIEVVLANRAV